MKNKPRCQSVCLAFLVGLFLTALGYTALWGGPPEPNSNPDPASAPAPARATAAETEKSFLMLRNGQMLEGRIYRVADRYEVVRPTGELFVPASQVLFHCETLEDAYQLRRRSLRGDSAQEHLELAQWCIQSRLFDAARQEITIARELDYRHPWLPLTERRLNMALVPKSPEAANPLRGRLVGPTPQELDRLVRSMPPKTVESFTQSIQPLLVNHCGAAGCHGYGSNRGFQLIRGSSDGPPTARTTQRNLHAALQWINLKEPSKSTLLTAPTAPHGSATTPVFADRQMQQYRNLVGWCYRVAQMKMPVVQTTYEEPTEPAASAASVRRIMDSSSRPIPSKNSLRPLSDVGDESGDSPSGKPSSSDAAPVRGVRGALDARGKRPATAGAAGDPVDPEAFNRMFAPKPPPSDESLLQNELPARDFAPDAKAALKPPSRESALQEFMSQRSRQPRVPRVEQRIPAEADE